MTTTPTPQRPRLRRRPRSALARGAARDLSQALALALPLALSLAGTPAQAADIGRARLVSAAGQPLQMIVPVTGLTASEAATLTVRVADAAAWQQTGLTPPVALESLRVIVTPGASADQLEVRVSAAEPPRGEVADLLLEVASASGQRRVQLSVIVTRAPAAVNAPVITPNLAAQSATQNATPNRATIRVPRGDMLWRIARRHQYANTTLYQMLAAFYQRNLAAFILENMNLLRANATLTVPDAASVRAIDPQAALRLFLAHQDAFFRWRAGRGARGDATSATALTAPSTALAPDDSAAALPNTDLDAPGDRLRLSGLSTDLAGDEQVARQRAERDAAERVAQLQRNLGDFTRVLQADAGSATTSTTAPAIAPALVGDDATARADGAAPQHGVIAAPASTTNTTNTTGTVPSAVNAATSPGSTATTARHGAAAGAAPGAPGGSAESLATATATAPAMAATGATTPRASTAANVPATPAIPSALPLDTASPQATSATNATTPTAATDSAPSASGQTATAAAAGSPATPAARPPLPPTPPLSAPDANANHRWYATPPYWLLGLLGLIAALGGAVWFVLRRRRNTAAAQHDAALRDKFTLQLQDIDLNLDANAETAPAVTAPPAPPKP